MQTQTIIYHKPTGRILTTLNSKYIRHRRDLLQYAQSLPLAEISFFYEPAPIDISTTEDRIKQITSASPPQVFSPSGESKTFKYFLERRRAQVSAADSILCSFEGGMGDQIMEAEAALQFYENYPRKNLEIVAYNVYQPIIQKIKGIRTVHAKSSAPPKNTFDLSVDMHTQYISDPRGGLHGKASLYGASIGLNTVTTKATLALDPVPLPPDVQEAIDARADTGSPKIGLHIRSGSGWGKCWNTQPAEQLARLFINQLNASAFLFGYHKDWQMQDARSYKIDQNFSWLQTAYIISRLDLIICVDSGPMHLARSQGVPHVILWGGTSYRDILGRDRQQNDYRLNLDCMSGICYDCPRGVPRCMTQINPQEVFDFARPLLEQRHENGGPQCSPKSQNAFTNLASPSLSPSISLSGLPSYSEVSPRPYSSSPSKYGCTMKKVFDPSKLKRPIRLNLGCEFDHRPDFTNVDINPQVNPDIVADALDLSFLSDMSCSEILASHILEHFYEAQVIPALREWNRVLTPGSRLIIIVPDAQKVCTAWAEGSLSEIDVLKGFIGDNQAKSPWMLHKTFFWHDRLFRLLSENNFDTIQEVNKTPGLLWLQMTARRKV
jgi:ADP-heptose:LPS heptosyltransferase